MLGTAYLIRRAAAEPQGDTGGTEGISAETKVLRCIFSPSQISDGLPGTPVAPCEAVAGHLIDYRL